MKVPSCFTGILYTLGLMLCLSGHLFAQDALPPNIGDFPNSDIVADLTDTENPRPEASFSVSADGAGTLKYQWYKNNAAISGATKSVLNLGVVNSVARAGSYNVRVSNTFGSVFSTSVSVIVIHTNPNKSYVLKDGSPLSLSVDVAGPVAFSWYVNEGDGEVSLSNGGIYTGTSTNTLKISHIHERATYTCTLGAAIGTVIGTFDVRVIYRPFIDQSSGDFVVGPFQVGQNVSMVIPYANHPSTVSASALPPGLVIKKYPATGDSDEVWVLQGNPTTAGFFDTVFSATNIVGTSTPAHYSVAVIPLPYGIIGSFSGLVGFGDITPYGGLVKVNITRAGSFSGTITLGARVFKFNNRLVDGDSESESPGDTRYGFVSLGNVAPFGPLILGLLVNSDGNIQGSVFPNDDSGTSSAFTAYRVPWGVDHPFPVRDLGRYVFLDSAMDETGDLGASYGNLVISGNANASLVCHLADGSVVTGSGQLDKSAYLHVHTMTFGNRGVVQIGAGLQTNDDTSVTEFGGSAAWIRPAIPGRFAPDGFSRSVNFDGGRYLPPDAGALILNVPAGANNVAVNLFNAGLPDARGITATLTKSGVVMPKGKDLDGFSLNPMGFSLTYTAATGEFSGACTLSDASPFNPAKTLSRPVKFYGQIIPYLNRAEGYFLLPQLPDGTDVKVNLTNTPILSG